jgi:hypothetical protein
MSSEGLSHIVYSKNVVEFVTVANEFCMFTEKVIDFTTSQLLGRLQKILPLIYLKASMLPEAERVLDDEVEKFVSELDYNILLQRWLQKLGSHDSFQEVFAPGMQFSEEALEESISEGIVDIYQDLKNFITSYSLGNEDVMNDALSECIFNYKEYWGQRLVNILRAVHMLLVGGIDLDEEQGLNSSSDDINETGWVDDFFGQFRDDKL